ncbi:DUF4339 domain-containing protein [Akkermansiaceae bacterium]|nr:DUF4339 domain-containing protein [Akkermansiaceae bacterium]
MKTWHYADQQNHPKQILDEEVLSLVNSGEIDQHTRIWTDGMADWVPAGELMPQLFNDGGSAPPPCLPVEVQSQQLPNTAMRSIMRSWGATCKSLRSNWTRMKQ